MVRIVTKGATEKAIAAQKEQQQEFREKWTEQSGALIRKLAETNETLTQENNTIRQLLATVSERDEVIDQHRLRIELLEARLAALEATAVRSTT
jgi:hypothetical protein